MFGSSVPEGGEAEDGAGAEDDEQDAKNVADDLEVAWEMLEVARVIYSRFSEDPEVEKELAHVYMRLGDLGMESDVFAQARSDYEKSLMLQHKILHQTKDPDTTPLADLYCCLAISCIYQDSAEQAAAAAATDDAASSAPAATTDAVPFKREEEGLKYYVLAGRVMAENIYRAAQPCSKAVQDFVEARIPKYTHSGPSSDEDADTTKGKGKRKAKATSETQELRFLTDTMDAVREEFLACVKANKGDEKAEEGANEDGLSKDEAQLLEYVEIYVELKEKVDGIKEASTAEKVEAVGVDAPEKEECGGVTTIGFGAAKSDEAATPAVNVIPVVKKRKVTPEKAAPAAN